MKRIVLGFLALLAVGVSTSKAQNIAPPFERQVVASAGQYLDTPTLKLSCTIGEPIVATLTNVKLILTQGFQQPQENEVSVNLDLADWNIKAYPNPFNDNVNIEITSDKSSEFVIGITNLIGQNLGMEYLANNYPGKNVYTLNTAFLTTGMYIVTVTSKDGQLIKSFKLNKIL
jgi:hypothetical protein